MISVDDVEGLETILSERPLNKRTLGEESSSEPKGALPFRVSCFLDQDVSAG